jgi:hypothetical protein
MVVLLALARSYLNSALHPVAVNTTIARVLMVLLREIYTSGKFTVWYEFGELIVGKRCHTTRDFYR